MGIKNFFTWFRNNDLFKDSVLKHVSRIHFWINFLIWRCFAFEITDTRRRVCGASRKTDQTWDSNV